MWIRKTFQARECGRQNKCGEDANNLQRTDCRPFHGLDIPFLLVPGVSLAKPRSTPGFMLAPAPQAKNRLYACTCSAG